MKQPNKSNKKRQTKKRQHNNLNLDMSQSLCGEPISSRRGLLASLWFLVSMLSLISFLTAFIYIMSSKTSDSDDDDYFNNGESGDEGYEGDPTIVVTSRALAFCAMWTAVLTALMSIFGTVVLGWQSPTGQYYTCCSGSVHRTTPLGLGSFIGALLMLSNLTLICSVLFGEFEIRENRDDEDRGGYSTEQEWEHRSTMAFSVLCMVLTVLYFGFAALAFSFANNVIDEHEDDEREEALNSTRSKVHPRFTGYDGYIGERFDVGRPRSDFASPGTTLS